MRASLLGLRRLAPLYVQVSLPCTHRSRSLVCAGLAPVHLRAVVLSRPPFVCAGLAPVFAPGLSRSPRACGSSPSVCAGLAPGVCGPRSRVYAGLAPCKCGPRSWVCAGSHPCMCRFRSLVRIDASAVAPRAKVRARVGTGRSGLGRQGGGLPAGQGPAGRRGPERAEVGPEARAGNRPRLTRKSESRPEPSQNRHRPTVRRPAGSG